MLFTSSFSKNFDLLLGVVLILGIVFALVLFKKSTSTFNVVDLATISILQIWFSKL